VESLNSPDRAGIAPPSQLANRLETKRWINLRSVVGLLLVFAAVFAGTAALQGAQRLVPVFEAARDLPSGTPLSSDDLSLVRVRLPSAELARYLRPDAGGPVTGRILTAPLRQHMLVPADTVVASREQGDVVELAINVDHGDMLQGLRPGDHVRILGAFPDDPGQGAARVLVDSAEVVRILEDSGGLAAGRREGGVQVRLPAERTTSVAAAIAGGRVFIVKAPALPSRSTTQRAGADEAPSGSYGPERPEGSP
jgi:SAF domain